MNPNSILRTEELYHRLSTIRQYLGSQQYSEVLAHTEEALACQALFESQDEGNARIYFLYYKAIAFDMLGNLDEALPLFEKLVSDYPGTPDFENSMLLVCARLEERAQVLIAEDPASPRIRSYLEILERHTSPPYWLHHAVAAQDATEGRLEAAWKRMNALLALSPNDAEYLRCVIALAQGCGDEVRLRQFIQRVENLLEEFPYRLDLAKVYLDTHGKLKENQAAS